MDKALKVTIGITSYNAQESIERAVRSALAQDWPCKEILIVDDNSTDETREILQRLQTENQALIVIQKPENKGVAAARNQIIENATGDFIAFFDDDDESEADRVTRQFERIIKYENAYAAGQPVICYASRMQHYPDNIKRIEPAPGTEEGIAPHGVPVALRILTGQPATDLFGSMATCSQMARRMTYRELGGFDETFRRSEDTDFNVRAALKGAHIVGISQPLVTQTMTRASEKTLAEEKLYTLKLLEKHRDFIDQYFSANFCEEWLIAKYAYLGGDYPAFLKNMVLLFFKHPVLFLKRIVWSIPNLGFNAQFKKHHANN